MSPDFRCPSGLLRGVVFWLCANVSALMIARHRAKILHSATTQKIIDIHIAVKISNLTFMTLIEHPH
jgi:hypothetical protein